MSINVGFYNSPIGIIEINEEKGYVTKVSFVELIEKESISKVIELCKKELYMYFNGNLKSFTVPCETFGTEFQKKVWNELTNLLYGDVVSYKYIAEKINNPKAVRAVGNTNRINKIAIIIPCHRVIGSNGNLVGYAGELWRKEWLINHEKKFMLENIK